jgi:DNA-binding CsgD family transcriptional regulator
MHVIAATPKGSFEMLPSPSQRVSADLRKIVNELASESGLSERETEVARLAAEGLVTKEIARKLGLSEKTVDQYWHRIYEKTGLRSQREFLIALLKRSAGP